MGTWKCVAPSAAAWSMRGRLSNAAGTQSAVVGTSPTSREEDTLISNWFLRPHITYDLGTPIIGKAGAHDEHERTA